MAVTGQQPQQSPTSQRAGQFVLCLDTVISHRGCIFKVSAWEGQRKCFPPRWGSEGKGRPLMAPLAHPGPPTPAGSMASKRPVRMGHPDALPVSSSFTAFLCSPLRADHTHYCSSSQSDRDFHLPGMLLSLGLLPQTRLLPFAGTPKVPTTLTSRWPGQFQAAGCMLARVAPLLSSRETPETGHTGYHCILLPFSKFSFCLLILD